MYGCVVAISSGYAAFTKRSNLNGMVCDDIINYKHTH